jgi:DNA repair protein RadD
MLKKIIENLSFSDKYSLLTERQKSFVDSSSTEQRGQLDLTNIIYQTLGVRLLLDKGLANLLIERMRKEQVVQALNLLKIKDINTLELTTPQLFSVLREVADKSPKDFVKALGLSASLDNFEVLAEKVQGTDQVIPRYPLYRYQMDCAHRVKEYIQRDSESRVLLHLPTGAGKTRTTLNIVCDYLRDRPNSLIVWLADTKELCEQAVDEFKKSWIELGSHSLPVYSFFGDSDLSISGISKGFLVASLQKLNALGKKDKDALAYLYNELRKHTSLVVFDEAHLAVAPTYKNTVDSFLSHSENNAFLIGLSATPGRMMGEDEKMHEENQKLSDFFHNNKVTMKVKGYLSPLDYLTDNQYLAKTKFIQLKYDDVDLSSFDVETQRTVNNSEFLKALSSNNNRNRKLIDTIFRELEDPTAQIIVFACTVDHAEELTLMLTSAGIACRCIIGSTSKIARASAIKDYKCGDVRVLVNYAVLTAGFDAPCTNVAIIARPTDSLVQYSQMAGRAMRGKQSGGNEDCRVYTVNDNIPEFRNVCHAFSYWDEMWNEE